MVRSFLRLFYSYLSLSISALADTKKANLFPLCIIVYNIKLQPSSVQSQPTLTTITVTPNTRALSVTGTANRSDVLALCKLFMCACRQVVPTSDRPPTCSGSSNSCQCGFSGRAANRISLSVLKHSQRVSSSSSVAPRTVSRGKSVGLGFLEAGGERRRRWAECNEAFRTGAAEQITSHNLWSVDVNRLIIEPFDLWVLKRIRGFTFYTGRFYL